MKFDTWYDIQCDNCHSYISTDFKVGMMQSKKELNRIIKEIGRKYIKNENKNLCPNCLNKVSE